MKEYVQFRSRRFLIFLIVCLNLIDCYYSDKEIDNWGTLSLLRREEIRILFVGDSLSERSNTFELSARLGNRYRIQDLSKSGWDIPRWNRNIDQILEYKPNILIIGLGTNDALNYPVEFFPNRYREFQEKLQFFLPLSFQLHTLSPPTASEALKEKIFQNNEWLRKEYNAYVDLFKAIENFQKNSEIPVYPIADPIHPNPIGYDIIGNEYKKAIIDLDR